MLSATFKPSEESGVIEPDPPNPEQARASATQAYRLLELWNRIPGARVDGTIDGAVLESWIKSARILAKTAGREDMADVRIGHMLSASPIDTDGAWPGCAGARGRDLFRSRAMIEGFVMGSINRRGVTTGTGGALERQEAAKYRAWRRRSAINIPTPPGRSIIWQNATNGRRSAKTKRPSAWTGSLVACPAESLSVEAAAAVERQESRSSPNRCKGGCETAWGPRDVPDK